MFFRKYILYIFFLLCSCNFFDKDNKASEQVVVSIKPIHSIVCSLLKNVTEPVLLLDGTFSPHSFSVTPSMISKIKNSKIFIWIGSSYESSLHKYLKDISAKIVTIQESKNIQLKKIRNGILWEEHHHEHESECECCHHHSSELDAHIWLNPNIVLLIVEDLSLFLQKEYPNNKNTILKNYAEYKSRIEKLKTVLCQKMLKYKNFEYIIQHDGTQYFDEFFKTRAVASVSIEPVVPASASHILKVKNAITKKIINPVCFFSEPQLSNSIAKGYANNFSLKTKEIDYLGIKVNSGENAYEEIMLNFVTDFIQGMN